jgi:LPXTG-site transpeptidase (sortase) family protein
MAATRMMGSLVAAAAVLSALSACAGVGTSDASTAAAPAVVTETPDVAARPAPAAAVPAVPRRSAALEDNQPVAPPAPNRIEIPDLGIDVAVQPAGLDEQGRMGLFDDPSIAAWYQWGPAPASTAGSTVIAAHVDSLEYDLLPFARLKDAVTGTQIVVTDAAGTRHPYAVQSVQVVDKADVDWVAAFDRAGPPRLTLVTCGGAFDYENRRYLSNLVLTAIAAG